MIKKDGFLYRSLELTKRLDLVSESAATNFMTYLGVRPIDIEGGEFDADVSPQEKFSFEFKTRSWVISIREGRKVYPFTSKKPDISASILFQTRVPAKTRLNCNHGGLNTRNKVTLAFTAKRDLHNLDWFVPKGASIYVDANKNYYFDVDLKTPILKMDHLTKKARASILTLMRKQDIEQKAEVVAPPKTKPSPVPDAEQLTGIEIEDSVTHGVVLPSVDRSRKFTTYLVSFPTDRDESVIVSPAPTLKIIQQTALALASNTKVLVKGMDFNIYSVDDAHKSLRSLKPFTVMLKSQLDDLPLLRTQKVKFDIRGSNYVDPVLDYLKLPEPNFAICEQNLDKFYIWLGRVIRDAGVFTKTMAPTAKRDGLWFQIISGGVERERNRLEIKAMCGRINDYLKTYQNLDTVHATQMLGKTKAKVVYQLPSLTATQIEAIAALKEKPPVLNAPIYFVEDQPQSTVTVVKVLNNTGDVIVHPVRRPGFGDETIRKDQGGFGLHVQGKWAARTVPYTKLKQLTMK
jgi:hypothetical protein